MRIGNLHSWPHHVKDATELQEGLCRLLVPCRIPGPPRRVAGCLVEYDTKTDKLLAAVVLVDAVHLEVLETVTHVCVPTFPQLPGYLGFREIPPPLEALRSCGPARNWWW